MATTAVRSSRDADLSGLIWANFLERRFETMNPSLKEKRDLEGVESALLWSTWRLPGCEFILDFGDTENYVGGTGRPLVRP